MVKATLAYISKVGGVQCSFCNKAAIGKFKISVYDWENGEKNEEKNMCQSHYDTAKKEGEVIAV